MVDELLTTVAPLDWPNAIQQLSEVQLFDYFKKREMPEFVEPLISELVQSFSDSSEIRRQQLLSEIPPKLSPILGWYARKLAGRAVRDHSHSDLRNGLIALAISAKSEDARDSIAPLALLYNSALRLQLDPKPLFETIAKTSTQSVEKLFTSFVERPFEQKSISVFGFSEGRGPYGFDYVPLLPEFGGPTPF